MTTLPPAPGTVRPVESSWWDRLRRVDPRIWDALLALGLVVLGVVLWGTFAGSMLPMALQRVGMDPAVSSAPFVATLVDVTGIVIYFEVAARVLRGTLL